MKLVSWNVNGIRAALKKGALDFFSAAEADVFCLQEVRATAEQFQLALPGYSMHLNQAEKKGYSGTAILSRLPIEEVTFGMGIPEHDREGRIVTARLADFDLVTVYTPNSQRGLTRLDYRQKWDRDFLEYLAGLEAKRPLVVCGDLNVAHREIDLTNPASNRFNAGFTDEERAGFQAMMDHGLLDTFRVFNQEGGHYTWWSNWNRARERNIGWRIDYFCISRALAPRLVEASIHPEIMGSDHCPVSIELKA